MQKLIEAQTLGLWHTRASVGTTWCLLVLNERASLAEGAAGGHSASGMQAVEQNICEVMLLCGEAAHSQTRPLCTALAACGHYVRQARQTSLLQAS